MLRTNQTSSGTPREVNANRGAPRASARGDITKALLKKGAKGAGSTNYPRTTSTNKHNRGGSEGPRQPNTRGYSTNKVAASAPIRKVSANRIRRVK